MPRRIKNSLADDMFEMLLDTPAWLGLAIPIGIYSLARWIAPWLLLPKDETAQTAVIGLQLGKISVQIAPYVGLFFFGMWAIAQVVRFIRSHDR
jgi:hypothetical protein